MTGSLQQTLLSQTAGSGLSSQQVSFTGTVNGNGVTLQLSQGLGSITSLVGQFRGSGFTLTYPGTNSSLTTIEFAPGQVADYNQAVSDLQVSQYSSPCTLYLVGHDAQLTITGNNAPSDCETFVQNNSQSGDTWTTTSQSTASSLSTVCDLTNGSDEVAVNDGGGQAYGQQVCNTFSSLGWGARTSTTTSTDTTSTPTDTTPTLSTTDSIPPTSPGVNHHCGYLSSAHDGPPGPGDITASNVSCQFARSTAYLLQCPAGWTTSGYGGGIGRTRCSHGNESITWQNV